MTQTQEIIDLEKKYVLQTYLRPDLVLEQGEGVWLTDAEGRRYLDAGSGIAVNALGHGHPALIEAIQQAAAGLLHVSNLYHTAPQARLARDLVESCFADRVFFSNSGAEANEGAIKFARKFARANGHADKTGLVAFTGSFHGRTMGALALTATEKYRLPFRAAHRRRGLCRVQQSGQRPPGHHRAHRRGDGGAGAGRGRRHPASPEFLAGLRARWDEVGACSSSMRCSAAWGAPAGCGRIRLTA
jgi:4-aminobutyrate aminotransferase-like enzyme